MPRKGYETVTMPSWIVECLIEAGAPSETPQSVVRGLLLGKLGKKTMQKHFDAWEKKYGR